MDNPEQIGNGFCNGGECNTEECGFDGGVVSSAMWIILNRLEMDCVMVENLTRRNVDLTGGIVMRSTLSIPTALWIILNGLEMEVVMIIMES